MSDDVGCLVAAAVTAAWIYLLVAVVHHFLK